MRVKKPLKAQQLLLLIQPFLSLGSCSTLIEISADLWSKRWAPLISEGLNKSQEAFLIEGTSNGSAPVCQIQHPVMGPEWKYASSTSLGSSGLGCRKQFQPLHCRLRWDALPGHFGSIKNATLLAELALPAHEKPTKPVQQRRVGAFTEGGGGIHL